MPTIAETMQAVLEIQALVEVVQASSEASGPVPDAITKAQLALQNLVAVLASQTPASAPLPPEPEPEPEPTVPVNTLL